MKKITLLFICLFLHFSGEAQTTDYVSGLVEVRSLELDGTTIYATGFNNIYSIDTTNPSPNGVTIYTTPANYFIYKTVKLGNFLYFLQENYNETTDTFLGTEIVRLDLTNLAAGITVLTSTTNFISSIALNGSKLYFTEEIPIDPMNPDVFNVNLNSINVSDAVPTAIVEYATLTLGVVQDLEFRNNIIYFSDIDSNEILTLDTSNASATLQVFVPSVSFNRGLFISGNDDLYMCNGNKAQKVDAITSGTLELVGENTTYQDTNNGNPFFANFRDVVLIGNTLYLALLNQGRIVTLTDNTLSTEDFTNQNKQLNIYPNPANNEFTIQTNADILGTKIYNVLGKLIMETTSKTINISDLNAGVYLVNITTNTKSFTKKLVKN